MTACHSQYWAYERTFKGTALSLQDKLTYQKQLRDIEHRRSSERCELFDAQYVIDSQRETLFTKTEKPLMLTRVIQLLSIIRRKVDWFDRR